MKKHLYFLYLLDNKILFFNELNQIYREIIPPKIIKEGKIIHKPKFIKLFQQFLKKNHLIKRFQYSVLYVIMPPNFEEIDKEILKYVFDDLHFQECKTIKETNLISVKKNELWINLNDSYAYLFFGEKKGIEFSLIKDNYLKLSIEEQIKNYLLKEKKIKKIIFYGDNKNIPLLCSTIIKKYNKSCYFFENYDNYLLKILKKHNFS